MTAEAAPATRIEHFLRSRPARWAGLVLGVGALVLLALALRSQAHRGETLFHDVSVGALVVSFLGFLVFQAGAIAALHALGGRPARAVWSAAQLAKYLPAPGAALLGMVNSAVVRGGTARSAVKLTLQHSAVLLAAALVAGAPSVADATGDRWAPAYVLAPVALVGAAIALAVLGTRGLPRSESLAALGFALVAWAGLGVALWAGVAHREGAALTVMTAFAAAWAVGFVALPVPAGIGIRETVLVLLLKPSLGATGALSFAVLTRLLHIASDAAIALAFLAVPSLRRSRRNA